MAMSRQAIAAENARRIVGRVVAATDNIGCRDKTTYDLYVARQYRQDTHFIGEQSADIIAEINRQAAIAEERSYNITFRVKVHIPSFEATADGLGVTG